MITAKIATNIAPRPDDGSGVIPSSTYDDLASPSLSSLASGITPWTIS